MIFLAEYQDLNKMKKYKNHIKNVVQKYTKLEHQRQNFSDSLRELIHFECQLPNKKEIPISIPIYPMINPYLYTNLNMNISQSKSIPATQLRQQDLQEINNLMEFIYRLKSKVTDINPQNKKPEEIDIQLNDITANLQEFSSTLDKNIEQIKNIN